jgi:hypothetical protein
MKFMLPRGRHQLVNIGRRPVNEIAIKEQLKRKRGPVISVGDEMALWIDVKLCLLKEVGKIRGEFPQSTCPSDVPPYPRKYRAIDFSSRCSPSYAVV